MGVEEAREEEVLGRDDCMRDPRELQREGREDGDGRSVVHSVPTGVEAEHELCPEDAGRQRRNPNAPQPVLPPNGISAAGGSS